MSKPNHKRARAHQGRRSNLGPSAVLSAPQSTTWNMLSECVPGTTLQLMTDNAVHNFVGLHELGGAFSTSTGTTTNFQYLFQASFLPGFSGLASVFDQYRVKKMEVYIEPFSASGNLVQCGGKLYTVVDYDDANAATVSQIQQYANVIDAPVNVGRVYRFTPHVAQAVYSGAFTGFGNVASDHMWIDSASNTVQHYGVKITAEQTTFSVTVNVRAKVWIQFRNQI